jgi:hypothetical protein
MGVWMLISGDFAKWFCKDKDSAGMKRDYSSGMWCFFEDSAGMNGFHCGGM